MACSTSWRRPRALSRPPASRRRAAHERARGELTLDEFGLIGRFFTRPVSHTALGVGDDAALVDPTPGCQTVAACDMLVEGVHFFPGADPRALGHKALAVNLSDLAAMGAAPRQALLGIALPAADEAWLGAFAAGFAGLAARFKTDWVGGDTTRGPLNLCVTVLGEVPRGTALLRSGAAAGDDIWISGVPGLGALGLAHLRGECALEGAARAAALTRLHTPEPRVGLGVALRGIASACIDVSDGVLADLGHVLRASGAAAGVGGAFAAELDWVALAAPVRAALAPPQGAADDALVGSATAGGVAIDSRCAAASPILPIDAALLRCAMLAGGDDYELLFSAPVLQRDAIATLARSCGVALTRVGRILAPAGGADAAHGPREPLLTLIEADRRIALPPSGYLHFG
ncbi:MAG: thiamine-phosphate kinase [Rhodocyclaceae bacterium]|nr:thiamine-phosphate kinase [Rhodocyclaceae bacterium]